MLARAVLPRVSARAASAGPPIRTSARATAVGAGTKSGSTQPRRAAVSQIARLANTVSSWRALTRAFIVAGSMRPAWTEGGLRQMRAGSGLADNPLRALHSARASFETPPPFGTPVSFGPRAGFALEEARQDVRADDESEGDEHERHVVSRSQQSVRMIDERAHPGFRAEDLADDDADHAQGEPGPQASRQREEHRGQHDPAEDGERARAVRARDGDEVRIDLADAGEHREGDREEAQQEAEGDLRGRAEAKEEHEGWIPDDRRYGVERGEHRPPGAADEPVHPEPEARAQSGRDRQRVRRADLAHRQPEARG